MIRKGQVRWLAKDEIAGQVAFVAGLFGLDIVRSRRQRSPSHSHFQLCNTTLRRSVARNGRSADPRCGGPRRNGNPCLDSIPDNKLRKHIFDLLPSETSADWWKAVAICELARMVRRSPL